MIARHTGERIRFFLLRTHYRSTIVYGEDGLQEAGTSLEAFYRFFDRFQEITGQSVYDLEPAQTREAGNFDPGGNELLVEMKTIRDKFLAAMDDDFNSGLAISSLFDSLRLLNRHIDSENLSAGADSSSQAVQSLLQSATIIRELAALLGVFSKPVATAGGGEDGDAELLDNIVHLLINLRKEARERKDNATGDAIRDRLSELGVALLDKKEGTTWERSS